MSDLIYKSYIISTREFIVLSLLTGIEKLHILTDGNLQPVSEEELNQIIFQLYQKDILRWKEEDSYDLNPDIKELFRNIKDSRKEIEIYWDGSSNPLICFWNASAVIMEISENDKDAVKLLHLSGEHFFMELRERGILPLRDSMEIEELEEETEETWGDLFQSMAQLTENGKVMHEAIRNLLMEKEALTACFAVLERKEEEVRKFLFILDCGIADWILCAENSSVRAEYYTLESFMSFFIVE